MRTGRGAIVRRIGSQSWWPWQKNSEARVDAFISFDVEALPIRAPADAVNTLIWGKTPDGEHGIRRLSRILREHKLKGNFLVDMAGVELYGEAALREVCAFLQSEGHEVHAHLHPEVLAGQWGFKRLGIRPRRMAEMDEGLSDMLLAFTADRFTRVAEAEPFLFRSGGYFFNAHTIAAAKKAGFQALSNYNAVRHENILMYEPVAERMTPFSWDGGIAEIPVDISSPEKSSWQSFQQKFNLTQKKMPRPTCNLVFHSWSLLRRNERGFHLEFGPELEEQFQKICAFLTANTRVSGYREYLQCQVPLPVASSKRCLTHRAIPIPVSKFCRSCRQLHLLSKTNGEFCPKCKGSLEVFP